MDSTFELTPGSARALALRLFSKEQFQADPRGCIVAALDWLDRAAAGDSPPAEVSSKYAFKDPLIARLDALVKARGLEVVAEGIKMGPSTIRSWLRGVRPTEANRRRVEQFLNETPAGAEQPAGQSGNELFDRQPERQDRKLETEQTNERHQT